jgi:hypothetical protein
MSASFGAQVLSIQLYGGVLTDSPQYHQMLDLEETGGMAKVSASESSARARDTPDTRTPSIITKAVNWFMCCLRGVRGLAKERCRHQADDHVV